MSTLRLSDPDPDRPPITADNLMELWARLMDRRVEVFQDTRFLELRPYVLPTDSN